MSAGTFPHHCTSCGAGAFFDLGRFNGGLCNACHSAANPPAPDVQHELDRVRGESWADECVRRVMAPRGEVRHDA